MPANGSGSGTGAIRVTPQELTSAANLATEVGQEIATGLTRLLNDMEGLQPGFMGNAGSQAQTTASALGQTVRDLMVQLNTVADNVHQANKSFANTDEGARAEIASVGGNNPGSLANVLRGGSPTGGAA